MASTEKKMRFELVLKSCAAFGYICLSRKRIFPKQKQHKLRCGKRNHDFAYVDVAILSTMSKKRR